MSLVGPRPEVERFVSLFPEDYQEILSVRPGLTDYAAIEYCDEEAILEKSDEPEKAYIEKVLPEKIRLYHKYLQDMSLQTDLLLIARTIAAIVR
jgi:lipopolysaccharide/colanic/teichoic acid biosynthesis glycosyltransferase